MSKRKIQIAHSPDSDDAFMFYALTTGKVDTGDFEFTHELHDIETLNQAALKGRYEISAVSIHAYAYFQEKYLLLNSGASMGEGYGPVLVSPWLFSPEELGNRTVAVPGERTSAFLALKLFQPTFEYRVVLFDEIIPALERREADAGLLIHEGQLLYRDHGLHKILDLGQWWCHTRDLPLPLGGNVIRRDLGGETIARISCLLRKSICYALEHRDEALDYSLQFGPSLDRRRGSRFVSMYVNERTLDYGEKGRQAVQLFLDCGYRAGVIPHPVSVEFV